MRNKILLCVHLLLLLGSLCAIPVQGKPAAGSEGDSVGTSPSAPRVYTRQHPLVYEDVSEMPPFSYANDQGNPEGYNIDLISILLDKLNIPYIVRTCKTPGNFEDLLEGKADLTVGMKAPYHDRYGQYGHSVVALFTHSIVAPKNRPVDVRGLKDLAGLSRLYVHEGSFSHHLLENAHMMQDAEPVPDMLTKLLQINSTGNGYMLWNTMSLKELIRRYKLDNVRMSNVSIPYGEYHMMSRDTVLLHQLDSVFEEMSTKDEMYDLDRKWFFPAETDDSPHYMLYITFTLAAIILVLLFYHIYYKVEEKRVRRLAHRQQRRLELALRSDKMKLWLYDVSRNMFRSINTTDDTYEEYSPRAFSMFYDDDHYDMIMKAIDRICIGQKASAEMVVKNRNLQNKLEFQFATLTISVLHTNDTGRPTMLMGALHDMSEEKKLLMATRDALLRYRTIFGTASVDVVFYDRHGYLIDINKRAIDTFMISDKQQLLNAHVHISEIPLFRGMAIDLHDDCWCTAIADYDGYQEPEKVGHGVVMRTGSIYYEYIMMPIRNDIGELTNIVVAGRDITESAQQISRERVRANRIKETTTNVQRYIDNINYTLQVTGTRLVNYYPEAKSLVFSENLRGHQTWVSQLRCVSMLHPDDRERAVKMLLRMEQCRQQPFEIRLRTLFHDAKGNPRYLEFSGLPIRNDNNKIDHYLCFCRDVSQLVETERQLAEETQRAQEAEKLKNSFLKNMSYEIRTPLNTVVGFAELFGTEHDKEDELVFTEEIKKSSKMLLELVDVILLLSRIDAKMIELNPQPVDVAETFRARCMLGWSKSLKPGVNTSIECPYRHLTVVIDEAQVGNVIERLTKLSSQFTTEGYIRCRMEYHNDTLTFIIEDTGPGISPTKAKEVLDRTAHVSDDNYSVGVELTVCNELVKLMGGSFDIDATRAKGVAIWVSIPCKLETAEVDEAEDTAVDGNIASTPEETAKSDAAGVLNEADLEEMLKNGEISEDDIADLLNSGGLAGLLK